MPVDSGFSPWCECGWNLRPRAARAPEGRITRIYADLGRRWGAQLFDAVLRDGAERPQPGRADVAVVVLSAVVFVSWLVFPLAAIVRVVGHPTGLLTWVIVPLLVLFAWVLRPRSPEMEDATEISANSHPRLVATIAAIADAVGAQPPRRVMLDDSMNACAGRTGLLRRPTLVLGVPLAATFAPQELVAILGHEMGHFVNGDTGRSVFVAAAYDTLCAWHHVTTPDLWDAERSIQHRLAAIIMWLLSWIPMTLLYAFIHLTLRARQRAEYYADRLGATVGGSEAMAAGLARLDDDNDGVDVALHRVVVVKSGRRPIEELAALRASLPPRERERRRRAAAAEPTSFDDTHPPTGLRIRAIVERPPVAPQFVLDAATHAEILRELAGDVERTERRLVACYERSLYA